MTTSANTPPLHTCTVEELVLLAQQNQTSAMEELVKRHQKVVYVALNNLAPERDDILDMTQDVLLKMCRSIKTLRDPKTFKFWLNRIITNRFYDALRHSKRRLKTVSLDEPFGDDENTTYGTAASRDIEDHRDRPDERITQRELSAVIRKAIEDLPEPFRTMIVLREIQGLSYEEIATLTNNQLGTVKSRIARARLRLQEQIGTYVESPKHHQK